MTSRGGPPDARLASLKRELANIAARSLRTAFKQAGDEDERIHYPTLADVVRELIGAEEWRRNPNHEVTLVVRVAIDKLPESMSGRAEGKELGVPHDEVKGKSAWRGVNERYLAAVLYGERDNEVAVRFNMQAERLTYDDHYRRYALELARFPTTGDDTSAKRMLRVIREDLAYILLNLKSEDAQLYRQSPTESGQPTQVVPDDEPAPTTFPRDHQQTESGVTACAGIANVTAGSTAYYGAVDAWYDQVVKLLLTYYNVGPDQRDQGITPRLDAPQRVSGERWKLGWHVQVGESTADPSVAVNLKRSDAVLTYIPGSTVWRHNIALPGESDDINEESLPDAAILAPTQSLDTLHWGDDYAATITELFRVQIPGIRVVIQAQSPANGNWLQELYAQPDTQIPVAITVQNTGNTSLYGAVAGASLPHTLPTFPVQPCSRPTSMTQANNSLTASQTEGMTCRIARQRHAEASTSAL